MKRILMTGALGQIGTELALYLGDIYGRENILATNRSEKTLKQLKIFVLKNLMLLMEIECMS